MHLSYAHLVQLNDSKQYIHNIRIQCWYSILFEIKKETDCICVCRFVCNSLGLLLLGGECELMKKVSVSWTTYLCSLNCFLMSKITLQANMCNPRKNWNKIKLIHSRRFDKRLFTFARNNQPCSSVALKVFFKKNKIVCVIVHFVDCYLQAQDLIIQCSSIQQSTHPFNKSTSYLDYSEFSAYVYVFTK